MPDELKTNFSGENSQRNMLTYIMKYFQFITIGLVILLMPVIPTLYFESWEEAKSVYRLQFSWPYTGIGMLFWWAIIDWLG